MTELKLRIGSRKSELALKQTYIIEDLLKKAYPGHAPHNIDRVMICEKSTEIHGLRHSAGELP